VMHSVRRTRPVRWLCSFFLRNNQLGGAGAARMRSRESYNDAEEALLRRAPRQVTAKDAKKQPGRGAHKVISSPERLGQAGLFESFMMDCRHSFIWSGI